MKILHDTKTKKVMADRAESSRGENIETEIFAGKPNKTLFKEIFFINSDSQSNIYCSAKLKYPSTTQERFLFGTLKGKVSCLERKEIIDAREKFHSCHDVQAREIYFSYINENAEIISMDAFYRSQTVRGSKCLIVGVTLILLKSSNEPNNNNSSNNNNDDTPKYFFNIYNALEPGTEFDLDKLAQVCQHQELNFIPYHLHHGDIYSNGCYEKVFLLAGSDKRIHVFLGDNHHMFEESPCEDYFPEFLDIPGHVIWMSIQNCDNFRRISAVGCDNGYVRVSLADSIKVQLLKSWTLSMDGPITSVHLFTLNANEDYIFKQYPGSSPISPRYPLNDSGEYNLLVTSALEASVVYLNVVKQGLSDMIVLEQSDQFDCVTCSRVKDIDCDGKAEIILGTYGQELLVYKWYRLGCGPNQVTTFHLYWRKDFSKPLLSVDCLDLMGDGMQELVVVSLTGVHILQHDINLGADKLLQNIRKAFSTGASLSDILNENKTDDEFLANIPLLKIPKVVFNMPDKLLDK